MPLQAACKLLSGFTGRLFEHNASEVYVLLVRIDDVYPSLRGRAQGHGGVPRHAQMPIDLRLSKLGLVDVQMPHLLGKQGGGVVAGGPGKVVAADGQIDAVGK